MPSKSIFTLVSMHQNVSGILSGSLRAAAKAKLEEENNVLDELRRENEVLKHEHENLLARLKKLVSANTMIVENRLATVKELKHERDDLTHRLKRFEFLNDMVTKKNNTLQLENDKLRNSLEELQHKITDNEQDNIKLEREQKNLENEKKKLECETDTLMRQICEVFAAVQKEKADLKRQYPDYYGRYQGLIQVLKDIHDLHVYPRQAVGQLLDGVKQHDEKGNWITSLTFWDNVRDFWRKTQSMD